MALTNLSARESLGISLAVVKFVQFSQSSGTADLTLVAAVTGKRIVVLSLAVVADAAGQSFTTYSGTSAGDVVLPAFDLLADNPFTVERECGVLATEAGAALTLKAGIDTTTSGIKGHIAYVEVS